MYFDRQDLAALISSRICHDLISPLGAISNGLELLEMAGLARGPEMELIAQSISNANSKIRFFRVAYGQAPNGVTMAQGEIVSILKDYFNNGRVTTTWLANIEAERRDVKLAFLAIQCLEEALPYGGKITVDYVHNEWVVSVMNARLKDLSASWALFDGQDVTDTLAASHVQFGMLAMLTQWRKPVLAVDVTDSSIALRF
ncbi:MAG: histidine phosphotransferase ChpT [Paracoccaceae bacterium]